MLTILSFFDHAIDLVKIFGKAIKAYERYHEEKKLAKEIKDKNDKETTENLQELLQ